MTPVPKVTPGLFADLTFERKPYQERGNCWGCGLKPDVMMYATQPMCEWCAELSITSLRHWPRIADNCRQAYERARRRC